MKNSKLIRVLRTFSSKERREMERFLLSPYFNKREDVTRLYRYLIEQLKENQEIKSKEEVQHHLFPGQAFDIVSFDLLMSYLFRLVRQFIQQKEMEREQWHSTLQLAKAYRRRGLTAEFNQSIGQLQQGLERQPIRNAHYYRTLYTLKWEQSHVLTAENPTAAANMMELTQSIDIEYLSTKLRHACLTATHRSIYQTDQNQIGWLQEILSLVENSPFLKVPCIAIYYYVYQMLQAPEQEANFTRFKKTLFANGHQFSDTEIRDLYLLAINYCVRQANEGKRRYLRELLELYQEGLKEKFLLENGVLSRFTFHNIVGVGLATENDEWTEQFIDQYKPTLEKKYRKSSYSFNRARLAYSRKNYDAALLLLQQSNYRDLLLNLAAKTLLLKIYYELQEFDLLQSHLEAMQKYLRRKRVIGYHKSNYRNIIHYTKKLLALAPDRSSQSELQQQIEAEKVLTEKAWLLEQLAAY